MKEQKRRNHASSLNTKRERAESSHKPAERLEFLFAIMYLAMRFHGVAERVRKPKKRNKTARGLKAP